jgi:hypothetical protein
MPGHFARSRVILPMKVRRAIGDIVQLADERGRPLGTSPNEEHFPADPE